MTENMKRWGCFNRDDYLNQYTVHGISGETGLPVSATIPFVMSMDCQYTLTTPGDSDVRCFGCRKNQSIVHK